MVKQGTRSPQIIKMHPQNIHEILEGKHEKFILKFGADYCPPCKMLAKFLDENTMKFTKDVPIYIIQLDGDQEEISETLSKIFTFKGIPYCVVTDKSMKIIDSLSGFDKTAFSRMVEKNFS